MANNIKGITIEIGGNTGPLDKALKGVNKTSRDLQKELQQVNYQLKFDPKNTILLQQKQKLLAESVVATKEKLKTLKEAEKQVQQQFKEGKVAVEQYRALQREVLKTQDQLKKLEEQAKESNIALSKIKSQTKNIADKAGGVATAMKPATIAIGVASGAAIKAGSDLNESLSKSEVAFKKNKDEIESWSKTTLNDFGLAQGTALDMATAYGDMATSMGFTTSKAAKMSKELVGRAADLSSYKNISIDVANTALASVFTGETESLIFSDAA